MPKIVRTARGQQLDFDLLKIKSKMRAGNAPIEVKERKNFIDNKMQRRIRKVKKSLEDNKKSNIDSNIDSKANDGILKSEPNIEPKAELREGLVDLTSTENTNKEEKPVKKTRKIKKKNVKTAKE